MALGKFARYSVAPVAVALTLTCRLALNPILGDAAPYMYFFVAIIVSGWLGGFGPGLTATILSMLVVDYLYLEPLYTIMGGGSKENIQSISFLIVGAVISLIMTRLRREQRRAAQAAEEVRLSEIRYRATYEHAEVGIERLDEHGRLVEVNPALCRMLGYTREELLARTFIEITHPDDRPEENRLLEQFQRREIPSYKLEKRYLRKDGKPVWVRLTSSLAPEGAGFYRISVVEDISDRKQAEAAQRESDVRFRTMADSLPQLAWIAQADGYIFWYNQRWYDYTGTTPQQMEGWGWQSVHDPAVLPKVLEQWTASIATGQPFDMIFPLLGADGRFRHFLTRVMPLKDAQGRVVQWFGTNTDVTERIEAEKSLLLQREWLQVTLTSIGDAVIAGDTAGRVTFLNPVAESLTGWNAAEAQGQPIQSVFKIINERTRQPAEDIVARVLREKCIVALANHTALVTREGHEIPIEDSAAPITDAAGNLAGVVLVFHDVTQRRHAQEALRENRELLRAVIEGTSDAVYVKDLAGRYLLFNAAAGRFTGKSPEEVIGQDDAALFPLDEAKAVMAGDRAVLASGQIMTYEEHVTDPLGKRLTFLSTKGPLRDEQGRVTALFGIARDITELKRAEEEMRESEARYRSLFENMLNGFAYCRMVFDRGRPEDFIYLDVNGAFEKLTGLKNVAGKKVSEVIPGIREADPELFEIYGRVALTGIPERFENYVKALDMWFDISVYSPGKEYFVAVFDVITERKRTEEAMRVSERRERERAAELATFLDAAPTPVFIAHDPDCLHLTGNRAADDLLRLPRGAETSLSAPDEVKPHHFRAVKDGRVLNNDELPAQRAARGEQVRDFEFSLTFDDGTTRHVLGYGTPLRNEKGEPRGAVHVLVDITDRKQAEEALRAANARLAEADRRKDEFLAMLAHELRNPISPVRSAVEILRLAGPKDPILIRQRDIIDRQTTHMARLLDDLLEVSRITRGKIELKRQPLHLDDVLVHAAETATPLIESRRHTLTLALPSDSLRVEGDLDRLAQAVGNLLTNAAKYTEEGGKIWLEAGREEGEAVIRVRDTGAGIAPEMLPRVFDLFAQADCTLARAKGGLGIGLTMVKKLVEMHGGSVEARSVGLGQGSEFIIRLPALEGEAPVPVRPDRPEERAPTPPRRILVVDDIADSADSLAQMLALSGHDARAVYDGPAALKMLCDFVPEVVLLDIGMPGMDGYEVVRRMRQKECGRKTLLVALTGYAQESDKDAAREAGFDYHLAKPVDLVALHDLLSRVDAYLA